MEKLINEIGKRIVTRYAPWTDKESQTPIDVFVAAIITRIGKAFLSGKYPELDKSLGVVGRWNLTDIYEPTGKWLQSWLKEMMFDKDMHTLIAFRKEEKKGASDKTG